MPAARPKRDFYNLPVTDFTSVPNVTRGGQIHPRAAETNHELVTYQAGKGPWPHYHPNDEQFIYLLEGRAAFLLGEEVMKPMASL